MQNCYAKIALGLTFAASTLHAGAQVAPTTGLAYNTQEAHSLTYNCNEVSVGDLRCEFVQTRVRPQAKIEDESAAIERARNEFKSAKPMSQQECTNYRDMVLFLEGKKTPPKPEGLKLLSPTEKADTLRLVRAMTAHCDKPTEASYVALVRLAQDKERRTCSVSSSSFSQSFRLASQAGGRPVWIAHSNPEGVCGIVQLSRFEPEEFEIGGSKFLNWKYVARKAVTNPSGELALGTKCGELDEKPYTYDWRSKEHQMTCDYIRFSAL